MVTALLLTNAFQFSTMDIALLSSFVNDSAHKLFDFIWKLIMPVILKN